LNLIQRLMVDAGYSQWNQDSTAKALFNNSSLFPTIESAKMPKILPRRFDAIILLVLLIGVYSAVNLQVYGSSQDDALSRINEAENSLTNAFARVYSAETAGANISDVLAQLNLAGDALGSARTSYENQDFDGALVSANQSITLAETVETEANRLFDQASAASSSSRWQTIALSSVGSAVFLVILGLAWIQFKRRYSRNFRSLRPEVRTN